MKKFLHFLSYCSNLLTQPLDWLAPFFALAVRLYIGYTYFWSGWLKTQSWSSTLYLFENEFHVYLLPPHVAAYLGTAVELIVPFFLILGLGARLPALVAFVFNVVMVVSYPILLTPEGACMVKDHYLWGALTAMLMFYGHGKLSLDHLLQKKVCPEYQY